MIKNRTNKNSFNYHIFPICLSLCLLMFYSSGSLAQQTWTTDPIINAGYTPIRANHINELRTVIDAKRNMCNLNAYSWSTLPRVGDQVKSSHFTELRTALMEIYTNSPSGIWNTNTYLPTYTNPELGPHTGTQGIVYPPIKAVDLSELRANVLAVKCCGDHICEGPETAANCPADCPPPASVCGNSVCESGESGANCPHDCCDATVLPANCVDQGRADGYNYCIGNFSSPTVGTSNGFTFMTTPTVLNGCSNAADQGVAQYTCGSQLYHCCDYTAGSVATKWNTTACAPLCNNNGTCDAGETQANCPADCGCDASGSCDLARGETVANCPADCGCNNNGTCQAARGETVANCPADCGCNNNGTCDSARGETVANCPADCGCNNNGVCQAARGETTANCPADCSSCGNGTCDGASDCAADCCAAGNVWVTGSYVFIGWDCNPNLCQAYTRTVQCQTAGGAPLPDNNCCAAKPADWRCVSGTRLCP